MSINYCTIGRDSIDGFCGNQRAKVLARLIHEAGHDIIIPPTPTPRPSGGGAISIGVPGGFPGFRPNVAPPQRVPFRQPYQQPDIDKNLPPREQPFITVTAEIMGMSGSETQEATQRLDFVMVNDLEINAGPEITVNISEMEI